MNEQPNHGSPQQCNVALYEWLGAHIMKSPGPLQMLDLGGGAGGMGREMRQRIRDLNGGQIDCIDTVAIGDCTAYDGKHVPRLHHSQDVVVLNWVLHHAAHQTIPLLREARSACCAMVGGSSS